jgi:hypothetical protein
VLTDRLKPAFWCHPHAAALNSPDLSPSEYHLFGSLKEALRGNWFTSDQEMKEVVHVSTKNILFQGHKEAFAAMNHVHSKVRGPCWKTIVRVSFLCVLE